MRIARVTGTVTLTPRLPELKSGRLMIVETLDGQALASHATGAARETPMPQSLVVYDELGAAEGQLIALSEGGEATQPFRPERVPIDAYCAAILDSIDLKD